MIQVSIGTAGVLGLAQLPMTVAPTTAYLMLGGRCAMDCAFCTQARSSAASDLALSRVTWPFYPLAEVCERLHQAQQAGVLQRCCLQVTSSKGYLQEALDTARQLRRATSLPLSVAIFLQNLAEVEALIAQGVDRIGFGLDAACERVFRQVKGTYWASMVATIEAAALRYPQHVAVHLVAGLGETEREMVERILWAHELGAGVSLFAFTPVRGTRLAEHPPPGLESYRRLQVARWAIVSAGAGWGDFSFDDRGVLRDVAGVARYDGEAFCTSGCPGCNRPFYNERPGGPMYNYARPLEWQEVERACVETGLPACAPATPGER